LLLAYTSALVFAVPAYVACARHGKTTPAASVAVGTLCTLPTAALIALVSHGVTASSPGAAPYAQLAQSMMAGAVVLPWGALSGAVVWALRFRMAR
jgi:ABC-type proline/glycine betaine transport system permease subunit